MNTTTLRKMIISLFLIAMLVIVVACSDTSDGCGSSCGDSCNDDDDKEDGNSDRSADVVTRGENQSAYVDY